jgi:hypothetical protein
MAPGGAIESNVAGIGVKAQATTVVPHPTPTLEAPGPRE